MKFSNLFITLVVGTVASQSSNAACDAVQLESCGTPAVNALGTCGDTDIACACGAVNSIESCIAKYCPSTTLDTEEQAIATQCAGFSAGVSSVAATTTGGASAAVSTTAVGSSASAAATTSKASSSSAPKSTSSAATSAGAAGAMDIPHIAGGLMAVLGGAAIIL